MFARFRIDLGSYVLVPADEDLQPIEIEAEGFTFRILKPYKSGITPNDRDVFHGRPVMEVTHALEPLDQQPAPVSVDERPAVVADTVQVEIYGDALTREAAPAEEPAIQVVFDVVNSFLQRLRAIGSAPFVRPISQEGGYWYLEYLDDNGTAFEQDPQGLLVRRRLATHFRLPSMPVLMPDGLWESTQQLPADYALPPWESLLLDARLLLESDRVAPEVGPAIVLAASAIETRIDSALQSHAESQGGSTLALWSWLTNRGEWWRAPSFSQKLSDILRALTERSLSDEAELWTAFRNLYAARNKYVHEGIATIGGQRVAREQAGTLLATARGILDWIEDGLPEAVRRPRYERTHNVQFLLQLVSPEPAPEPEEQ